MNRLSAIKRGLAALWSDFTAEWPTVLALTVPVFFVLLALDFMHTNIGFLQLYSIDEYTFHGSLRHMQQSLFAGDLAGVFGYGFYQYGFVYFALTLLFTLPALLLENSAWALIVPRIITSLFAVGSLVVIYKTARLFVLPSTAFLIALCFVTFPAFWFNATWFHPDWAMTFFLLLTVFCLAKDEWKFKSYFVAAILSYALAVAFKYQAITALPLIGLYIFYAELQRFDISGIIKQMKIFFYSLATVVVVFVLANPFILHPIGWRAFYGSFASNMESNATNHGIAANVSIAEKITAAIGDYYFNEAFFLIVILIASAIAVSFFTKKEKSVFPVIACYFLLNIAYLFFFVNKAWQIYYLPAVVVGLLILVHLVRPLSKSMQTLLLAFIIAVQGVYFAPQYVPLLTVSRDIENPDFNDYSSQENEALNAFVLEALAEKATPESTVLITPYTPFEYERLGIPYEQVRTVFGALRREQFDLDAYIRSQQAYWGALKSENQIAGSFQEMDFIVMRKNIPYIETERISLLADKEGYLEAAAIVENLYTSEAYTVLAENDHTVIFERINPAI